ncbi:type II secretion system protein GspM [Limnobacter sp.]|uniref:type II secretion system protein GspM n=1 Tax=Limnobacter sp. TaxID=2003368 RepID=UPI003518F431
MSKRLALGNSLRDRLDQLNPRERKLVTWGGLVAGLLVLWLVLLEPAWLTVQKAPENQAALVDKAALVMRAAQDLEALRGTRSRVVVRNEDLDTRIQQMLLEHGIAEQATLRRTEEGDMRVEFTGTSATGWLAWLAQVEGISSLTLAQAEMSKDEAGIVSGYVSMVPNQQASKP